MPKRTLLVSYCRSSDYGGSVVAQVVVVVVIEIGYVDVEAVEPRLPRQLAATCHGTGSGLVCSYTGRKWRVITSDTGSVWAETRPRRLSNRLCCSNIVFCIFLFFTGSVL